MNLERRSFLGASLAAAALLAARAKSAQAPAAPAKAAKPLSILVFGGTSFIGPAMVPYAMQRGHKVTLFNRGKTRPELFPELEKLRGDRDPLKGDGLKALEGKKFDVVIDDCGYYPRHVEASAKLLAPNAAHYIYVSSISAYADNTTEDQDEDAKLAELADPTVETMGPQYEHYGGLKVLCERAAEAAFKDRATIVRPGYIVGPGDWTGRFNYWVVRAERGGTMLVPGAATDPLQIIDVRDLGEWMIRLAENKTLGRFNACGPEKRLPWGEVIDTCVKVGGAKDTKVRWMSLDELEKHKEEAAFKAAQFSIWAPYVGESKGFHTWKNERGMKAGLTFRPLETTVRDTLAWWKDLPKDSRGKRLAGPTAEQEAEMLKLLG